MYLTVYVNTVTLTVLVLKEQLGRAVFTMYAKLQCYKILNQTAPHLTGVTCHTIFRNLERFNVKFRENPLGNLADARTWGSVCFIYKKKKFG
jgi:hypothetical protein